MARAVAIPSAVQSASGAVGPQAPSGVGPPATTAGKVTYLGHSGIRETAGGPATVTVRDSGGAAGTILEEIVLAANGFAPSVWKGPQGITGNVGLYIHFESGTGHIEGSLIVA